MRPEPQPDKPPYRVPSMAEIAAVPWNGKTIVSTFSGCGGSCLGFKMAGYRVAWASEFVPAAQDVYRLNHPDTILDTRDIRTVTGSEILESIGMGVGEVDVLEGSPPCASFSTAGKRERGWGKVNKYSDVEQRSDDLFFEYVRLIEEIQPKAFVAENVSGLVKGTAKGYFKLILKAMKERGYRVEARLLDAQWLGVPQARQRIIFVGVRGDIDREPAFPTPLPYRYSVRDALPWIIRTKHSGQPDNWKSADSPASSIVASGAIRSETAYLSGGTYIEAIPERVAVRAIHDTSGEWSHGDITDRPSPTVTVGVNAVNSNHYQIEEVLTHDPETGERISLDGYAIGAEWDKLNPGEQSDRYFNLVRGDTEKPSPTIMGLSGHFPSGAQPLHPVERRKFTIAELRRICAFPDDFQLTGSYAQQWERLGRAVPPVMMAHVAHVVRDEVLT